MIHVVSPICKCRLCTLVHCIINWQKQTLHVGTLYHPLAKADFARWYVVSSIGKSRLCTLVRCIIHWQKQTLHVGTLYHPLAKADFARWYVLSSIGKSRLCTLVRCIIHWQKQTLHVGRKRCSGSLASPMNTPGDATLHITAPDNSTSCVLQCCHYRPMFRFMTLTRDRRGDGEVGVTNSSTMSCFGN